jgi:hypothetical protein
MLLACNLPEASRQRVADAYDTSNTLYNSIFATKIYFNIVIANSAISLS